MGLLRDQMILKGDNFVEQIKINVDLLGTIFGFAIMTNGATEASKIPANYTFDYQKAQVGSVPYKAKLLNKSAYLWNYSHTKRLHNIKNYPNSNWYVFFTRRLKITTANEQFTIM